MLIKVVLLNPPYGMGKARPEFTYVDSTYRIYARDGRAYKDGLEVAHCAEYLDGRAVKSIKNKR